MRPLLYFVLLVFSFSLSCHLDKLPELILCPIQPVASFSPNSTNCSAPCTITITNNSVSATKYKWDFGDGTTATTYLPGPHLYDQAGSYSISLIASNNEGCADTVSQVITITAGGPAPVADFTVDLSNNGGVAPCVAKFSNLSINANSFIWDFGDNSQLDSTINPTHYYKKEGDYIIKLIAKNNVGENQYLKTVKINAIKFSISYSAQNNAEGLIIKEDNNNEYIIGGFSDGTSSTSQYYLLKINKTGSITWEIKKGGNKRDYTNFILQNNVHFLSCGKRHVNSDDDAYFLSCNLNISEIVDEYFIKLNSNEEGLSLIKTQNNTTFLMLCSTDDGKNFIIKKINYWGAEIDDYIYGITESESGSFFPLNIIENNGYYYVVSGFSQSGFGPVNRIYLSKITDSGQLLSEQRIDNLGAPIDFNQASDGNLIILTNYVPEDPDPPINRLLKISPEGNILINIPLSETYKKAINLNDGGYLLMENIVNSPITRLTKLKSDGTLDWNSDLTIAGALILKCNSVIETSDGGFALTGFATFGTNGEDIVVFKTDRKGTIQ